ncbi:MAG: Rieske 2Fe-2S domain-containing protein [Chloroflexi bacterium]|nr:Rieske 2Fe-2S domain-containing protein [Chloroflexota bacterium]
MEPMQHVDIVHTGPGTPAGSYLRMFWQPMGRAQDLAAGQSLPIQIMSEHFTLYRGESGTPYVLAFRCAHRGTQLSTGWVEEDDLRCLYHGWKYDGSGQCVERPGESPASAAHVKIRSYPTQEYLGLIFAYLGEGAPPPIKRFPDFEHADDLAVGPPQLWPCNYFNRIDNACDPMHVGFTHSASVARLDPLASRYGPSLSATMTAEETEYGVRAILTTDERVQVIHFHMPNINQLGQEGRPGAPSNNPQASPWGERLFWRVPVDDEACVSYLVGVLNLQGLPEEERERRRRQASMVTAEVNPNEVADGILTGKLKLSEMHPSLNQRETFWIEDYVTEVGQGPIADRASDRLGRFDTGIFMLRKIWQREVVKHSQGQPIKRWASTGGLVPTRAIA